MVSFVNPLLNRCRLLVDEEQDDADLDIDDDICDAIDNGEPLDVSATARLSVKQMERLVGVLTVRGKLTASFTSLLETDYGKACALDAEVIARAVVSGKLDLLQAILDAAPPALKPIDMAQARILL